MYLRNDPIGGTTKSKLESALSRSTSLVPWTSLSALSPTVRRAEGGVE